MIHPQIYVAHSRDFDFKTELYMPLRSSVLNDQCDIILPHETDQFIHSKPIIQQCDLLIAEVSFPSIGLGIELGWADCAGVPIMCIHRASAKPSSSISAVSRHLAPYSSASDMLKQIQDMSLQLMKVSK